MQLINKILNRLIYKLNYTKLDIAINNYKRIPQNKKKKIICNLLDKYNDNPNAHLLYAKYLFETHNFELYNQLNIYNNIRKKWFQNTGLSELNMEFISSGIFAGALGNLYNPYLYLNAQRAQLAKHSKLICLIGDYEFSNSSFVEYFKEYVDMVYNKEIIYKLNFLEKNLLLPLGFCTPLINSCHLMNFSNSIVLNQLESMNLKPLYFKLKDSDFDSGKNLIAKLGIPKNAWYVTLHIRGIGWRGETMNTTQDIHRTADPLDYIDAIKEITKKGGYVVRMGDPSMKKLPNMKNVIDYAHHPMKSALLDVFLGATSKFCIGTSSGYCIIPMCFGVPLLLTNMLPTEAIFSLNNKDMYIPKILLQNGKAMNFKNYFSKKMPFICQDKDYKKQSITWKNNTPNELKQSTKEFIDFVFEQQDYKKNDQQVKVNQIINLSNENKKIRTRTNIPASFLDKYNHLI